MAEFFESEFYAIHRSVRDNGRWTVSDILRAKNWKKTMAAIETPLDENERPMWEEVERDINLAFEGDLQLKIKLQKICSITGIKFAFGTTILAMMNPKRWAVFDKKLMKFFSNADATESLQEIFPPLEEFPPDLITKLNDLKGALHEIDETHNFKWNIVNNAFIDGRMITAYEYYLEILELSRDALDFADIREVEVQIWES